MVNKKTKAAIIAAALAAVAGCDGQDQGRSVNDGSTAQAGRVTIKKLGTFSDTSAYSNWRSVYLVTDTETGQEFIGVSGIGIAETGSHGCGKSRCSHEE